MAEKTGLVRQWPGYLWRGAAAALASVLLQCGVDLAFGEEPGGLFFLLGDWLGNLAFFALAQALFPSLIVRFKRIPTALGVSLALGGFAGYIVFYFYQLIIDPMSFDGQQVITFLFRGAFLGLVTGLGWDLAKGRAVGFWAGFLAACAAITAFYHFTTPAEDREAINIFYKGLTLTVSYLPVVAVIWWRHRPRDEGAGEPSDSTTAFG